MKNHVELVFILDKSGSMSGLESDTVGGFNSMLQEQKKLDGEVLVSTVLFNNYSRVLHNRLPINEIEELTVSDYRVGGATALLDALGNSIQKIRKVYADTLREERASKVIFMITTDGMENASREYDYNSVQRLIHKSKEEYDWEFVFIGANIDSVKEAARIGISKDRAVMYRSDKRGTRTNFKAMNTFMADVRASKVVDESWKKEIEDEYNKK